MRVELNEIALSTNQRNEGQEADKRSDGCNASYEIQHYPPRSSATWQLVIQSQRFAGGPHFSKQSMNVEYSKDPRPTNRPDSHVFRFGVVFPILVQPVTFIQAHGDQRHNDKFVH